MTVMQTLRRRSPAASAASNSSVASTSSQVTTTSYEVSSASSSSSAASSPRSTSSQSQSSTAASPQRNAQSASPQAPPPTLLGTPNLTKSVTSVSSKGTVPSVTTSLVSNTPGLSSGLTPALIGTSLVVVNTLTVPRSLSGGTSSSAFGSSSGGGDYSPTTGSSVSQSAPSEFSLTATTAIVLACLVAVFAVLFIAPCIWRRLSRCRSKRRASALVEDLTVDSIYPVDDYDAKTIAVDEKAVRRASYGHRHSGRVRTATWTAQDAQTDLRLMDEGAAATSVVGMQQHHASAMVPDTTWQAFSQATIPTTPTPGRLPPHIPLPSPHDFRPEYDGLAYAQPHAFSYSTSRVASYDSYPVARQVNGSPNAYRSTEGATSMAWNRTESVYSQQTEAPLPFQQGGVPGVDVPALPPLSKHL